MSDRRLVILFGSQTGTAQDVAESLWRDAKRRHFQCDLLPMDEFDINRLIQEPLIVFICSTTGQGEEPDNMKRFWRFLLRRNLPPDSLSTLKMAVLGLGDASYQKFNFAAKKLYRRLLQLGAQAVCEPEWADEQHELGIEGVSEPWAQTLWDTLLKMYPLPQGMQVIPEQVLLPPKYIITWGKSGDSNDMTVSAKSEPIFLAPLLSNQRVTAADHFQDTRLISLDISNTNLHYSPGDVAMVQPSNFTDSVHACAKLLNLTDILDSSFSIEVSHSNIPPPPKFLVPNVCTVRHCLERYFDLQCVPRKSFFKILACFAEGPEKERLEEFCAPENLDELYSYCNRPRRSTAETLADFPNAARNVPFAYLFDLLTPIRPRAFSIASCQEVHGNQLQLLVAVVQYKTRLAKQRRGLCSTWLSGLFVGDSVPMWIKSGTLKFPPKDAPCILIGPGTGVAPLRSFVHWSAAFGRLCPLVLLFGARNKSADFYFSNEWLRFENLKVITAFSRDQPHKIYVQHKIGEHGAELWKMIENGAFVFVVGNANQMPNDVTDAFKNVIQTHGNVADCDNFITNMEKGGRLQFETWS